MDNYTLSIRWDYLIHLCVYLPLPLFMFLGLMPSGRARFGTERSEKPSPDTFPRILGLISLILVIPALFEVVQMLLPYRTFNINDLVANEVGVMLGVGLMFIFRF